MRYCYYCKKAMHTSDFSVWINGVNYDAHKTCSNKSTKENKLPSFTEKCICDWSKDDEFGFIPNTECTVHGKQTKKMLSKTVPIKPNSCEK